MEILYGNRQSNIFLFVDSFADTLVFAGAGNDILDEGMDYGSTSDDIYFGGRGNDLFASHAGNDLIRGGRGDDRVHLYGSEIVDARGGRGHDVLYIHSGWDGNGPNDNGPNGKAEDFVYPEHNYRGFEEVIFL